MSFALAPSLRPSLAPVPRHLRPNLEHLSMHLNMYDGSKLELYA